MRGWDGVLFFYGDDFAVEGRETVDQGERFGPHPDSPLPYHLLLVGADAVTVYHHSMDFSPVFLPEPWDAEAGVEPAAVCKYNYVAHECD